MVDDFSPVEYLSPIAPELEAEMEWLCDVLDFRYKQYFKQDDQFLEKKLKDFPAPTFDEPENRYTQFVKGNEFNLEERVAVVLCITVHIRPQLLDLFFTKNATYDRAFSQFGGWTPTIQSPFLPTGETLIFILAADDLAGRLEASKILNSEEKLIKQGILELGTPTTGQRRESGLLQLSERYYSELIQGQTYRPEFSASFPAQRLQTERKWEELILPKGTISQLEEIKDWIDHEETLLDTWNMRNSLRPGYRSLFYGPPGTGKTMAASLLGKITGRAVYRIDLSMIVSKYIGETEKNLANVFRQAEHQKWILFFDEADALFGKRTEIKDAHDRYANQEVAYLLQRVEQFDGIVILASNQRSNLDEAFTRRFESISYFPMPGSEQRLQLWQQSLPSMVVPEQQENREKQNQINQISVEWEDVLKKQLPTIAQKYELSGGAIINVARFAALRAARRKAENDKALIMFQDVMEGIRVEYGKEGRSL